MDPIDSVEREEPRATDEAAPPATGDGAAPTPDDSAPEVSDATIAHDAAGASDQPEPASPSAASESSSPDRDSVASTPDAGTGEAPEPLDTPVASRPHPHALDDLDDLDAMAVTAPLKSRRANGADAALTASLAAAIGETPDAVTTPEPLTTGATLAGYTIERLLREDADGPVYLAAAPEASADTASADTASAEASGAEAAPWRFVARAVPESEAARLERVVAAGARAPGLLAPVAFDRFGGRAYVIGVELPGLDKLADQPAPTLSASERLRPVDALTACTQLASALSALHQAGLAHLHVSPDLVTLFDGRVYLGGVEQATPVADEDEAKALYARDANFLARTVAALGGANDVTLWDHDSSAQRSLREIAARGEAGGYNTIEEVAEAGSLGLQMLMVAGVSLGADIRAVRLRIESGAMSSVGRVRSENQDAWAATQLAINDDAAADAPLGVFLVADGMGGEARGEIASRFVARFVTAEMARRYFEPQSAWPALAIFNAAEDDASTAPQVPLTTALAQAVKEANRRTRAFGARINATTGSTVTALAVAGARAALAHLGDSRAYLLRDGQLLQLTEDHSLLARLEAIRHPLLDDPSFMAPRSVLYRSIGQEDDVEPDMLQFVLAPGDRIMICSDGLWDEVPREAIGETMAAAEDPRSCAASLVAQANASGGHDNSTALVLFISSNPIDQPFAGASPDEISAAREALGDEPDLGDELAGAESATGANGHITGEDSAED